MSILKIKETCLYFRDLNSASKFYHETLGFPVISEVEGRHLFFRVGSSVLLCFNPDDSSKKVSPPPHSGSGPIHLAFEVDPDEYQSWKLKILNAGIDIIDETTWGDGQKSFYFHDPAGHVLEIVPTGIWGD